MSCVVRCCLTTYGTKCDYENAIQIYGKRCWINTYQLSRSCFTNIIHHDGVTQWISHQRHQFCNFHPAFLGSFSVFFAYLECMKPCSPTPTFQKNDGSSSLWVKHLSWQSSSITTAFHRAKNAHKNRETTADFFATYARTKYKFQILKPCKSQSSSNPHTLL